MIDVVVYVPLRRRGSVVAWAKVEAADGSVVLPYRWRLDKWGYARRSTSLNGRHGITVLMHRAVMAMPRGDRTEIDHINCDPLDNRRSNLRLCTREQNAQNTKGRQGTSRYRGVSWSNRRGKWVAACKLGGKLHWLGYFDDEDEAAEVAAAFRAEHMPYAVEAA